MCGEVPEIRKVPAAKAGDIGKVLTVGANRKPGWATGGGGGAAEATQNEVQDPATTVSDKYISPRRVWQVVNVFLGMASTFAEKIGFTKGSNLSSFNNAAPSTGDVWRNGDSFMARTSSATEQIAMQSWVKSQFPTPFSAAINVASYNLGAADANTAKEITYASGNITIYLRAFDAGDPTTQFPANAEIDLYRNTDSEVNIVAGEGVTLVSVDTKRYINKKGSPVQIKRVGNTDNWYLVGDLKL